MRRLIFFAITLFSVNYMIGQTTQAIVFDLTGAITTEMKVETIVNDQGVRASFEFDSSNNYLSIYDNALFYYAMVSSPLSGTSYLYMGPKTVQTEPMLNELPPPPSPVQKGLRAAGKGTAISLGSGTLLILNGVRVANTDPDPWAGFTWVVVGTATAVYGTLWSVIYGTYKGVKQASSNSFERRRARVNQNTQSSSTFVVLPLQQEDVPKDLLQVLTLR